MFSLNLSKMVYLWFIYDCLMVLTCCFMISFWCSYVVLKVCLMCCLMLSLWFYYAWFKGLPMLVSWVLYDLFMFGKTEQGRAMG